MCRPSLSSKVRGRCPARPPSNPYKESKHSQMCQGQRRDTHSEKQKRNVDNQICNAQEDNRRQRKAQNQFQHRLCRIRSRFDSIRSSPQGESRFRPSPLTSFHKASCIYHLGKLSGIFTVEMKAGRLDCLCDVTTLRKIVIPCANARWFLSRRWKTGFELDSRRYEYDSVC